MPIYEYRCLKCHQRVEVLQRVSDPTLETCPDCGGDFRKVISPVGIIFKGSGFHVTDYGRKGTPRAIEKYQEPAKGDDKSSAEKKKPAAEKKDKPIDSSAAGSKS